LRTELRLELLENTFAIHRFSPFRRIPEQVFAETFFNIVKTDEELSIVCPESLDLASEHCHRGWSCIKVSGPLDLDDAGILANLSGVLAKAQISIFVVSSYDTDYLLIPAKKSHVAVAALQGAGYQIK